MIILFVNFLYYPNLKDEYYNAMNSGTIKTINDKKKII